MEKKLESNKINCKSHPNMWRHFIGTNLGQIPAEDPIVEAIEDEEQATVYPSVGLGTKQQVEAHHRHHNDDVTHHTQAAADLVDQQEPLIHLSGWD